MSLERETMGRENTTQARMADTKTKYAWRKEPRKFAPKSRRGCKTCKVRRVKCDLAWPSCHRCASTGRTCEENRTSARGNISLDSNGIAAASHIDEKPLQLYEDQDGDTTKPVVLQHEESTAVQTYSSSVTPGMKDPLLLRPESPQEFSAMRFFDLRTLPQLSECRRSPSWMQTLTYFSNTEKCVHHAAVALSTLHRAFSEGEVINGWIPDSGRSSFSNLGSFALMHYNLAIRHLLGLCSPPTTEDAVSRATVLMVCYLFTSFDNLAGNYNQGAKHLKSGLKLLNETRLRLKDGGDIASPSSCCALVDQITEQFRHLELQAATFYVDWQTQLLPVDDYGMSEAQGSVASISINITAPSSLESLADRLGCIIPKVMGLRRWEDVFLEHFLEGTVDHAAYNRTLDDFLMWRAQMTSQLEQWSDAFELWQRKQRLEPKQMCASDERLIQMLRLHYITTSTFLLLSSMDGEMAYDSVLPEFKTAVALAAAISASTPSYYDGQSQQPSSPSPSSSPNPNPEPSFTLEMGIVPPLWLIGIKCRDHAVRREIISILRRRPRREGVWDSVSSAQIIERLMEIEEGGSGEDHSLPFELGLKTMADIPNERRVSRVMVKAGKDYFGSSVSSDVVTFFKMCGEPQGLKRLP